VDDVGGDEGADGENREDGYGHRDEAEEVLIDCHLKPFCCG
jgi:hypothetical protein